MVQFFSDGTSYRLVNSYGRFGWTWRFGVQRLCIRRWRLDCTGSEAVGSISSWTSKISDNQHCTWIFITDAVELRNLYFQHDFFQWPYYMGHCHHGMARPQVADGDLQIWRVAANIMNKQSQIAEWGWFSSMAVGRRSLSFNMVQQEYISSLKMRYADFPLSRRLPTLLTHCCLVTSTREIHIPRQCVMISVLILSVITATKKTPNNNVNKNPTRCNSTQYSLQVHSTCFGCHSTHHEYTKL